jgi:hypothetical protein
VVSERVSMAFRAPVCCGLAAFTLDIRLCDERALACCRGGEPQAARIA